MEISKEELNLLREWYNSVHDLNKSYLEQKDTDLYNRIITALIEPK